VLDETVPPPLGWKYMDQSYCCGWNPHRRMAVRKKVDQKFKNSTAYFYFYILAFFWLHFGRSHLHFFNNSQNAAVFEHPAIQ